MEVMRWVLVGIIGVITGIVAFIINITDKYLMTLKLSIFETSTNCCPNECLSKLTGKLTSAAHTSEDGIILGFLALLFLNMLFAILASVLIVFEVYLRIHS